MGYHNRIAQEKEGSKSLPVDPLHVLVEKDNNVNCFLPLNFERFVLTGEYQKLTWDASRPLNGTLKIVFVTGCGRSGTTLMFDLLRESFHALALNEPREIYLNACGRGFDIWSKKATKGTFKLDNLERLRELLDYLTRGRELYIEKMPEHILRVPELIKAFPQTKFIYMQRHWYEVAYSISHSFGGTSFYWYGYDSAKWLALLSHINDSP
jgi:hypothetical protein